MMIRRNPELIGQGDFFDVLKGVIREHESERTRLDMLSRYYRGDHDILYTEPEEGSSTFRRSLLTTPRLVCNYAKFITDMATGYMFGKPVEYRMGTEKADVTDEEGFAELFDKNSDGTDKRRLRLGAAMTERPTDVAAGCADLKKGSEKSGDLVSAVAAAESAIHDAELGKALSVYGYAFELVYFKEAEPNLAVIDPTGAFVVYDDTVKAEPVFAVVIQDKTAVVYFSDYVYEYALDMGKELSKEKNMFGEIPLIQYWNNEEGMGDFEAVLSLIDAYNILQSDRVADKQRFVNAILKVSGAAFETDEYGRLSGDAKALLRSGILQLPEDAEASYLTKSMDEADWEILRNSIASDIHKFSQIPDFSDRHFAGNSSGVALRFKLISLEYLCRVKERFFASGLKARLKLFAAALFAAGFSEADSNEVEIIFHRELPFEM